MEFLVLEVDGARFGIPTSDVREVVRAASLGAPPARFPKMIGILNYRGNVLGVLEMTCLRGRTDRALTPQDHMIILQAAGGLFVLRVDRAVEIMTWADGASAGEQSTGQPLPEDLPPGDGLQPIAHPRLGVVYLLDTATLWSELHLQPSHPPAQEVEAG